MDMTGQRGIFGLQLVVRLIKSLRKTSFFGGNQEPEPCGSSGKRARFAGAPSQVFPSPELEPKQGPRANAADDDICPAPLQDDAVVVKCLMEDDESRHKALDGLKLRMSSAEPRGEAVDVDCLPWKKLLRCRGKRRAPQPHLAAEAEEPGAPQPQQAAEVKSTKGPGLQALWSSWLRKRGKTCLNL